MVAANVGPTTPLPQADAPIHVAFDRYLEPITANRQGVLLLDLFGNAFTPVVDYDPITRTITLSKPVTGPWLQPGLSYSLFFPLATADGGPFGLRAIDGTTIDPATQRIDFPVASTDAGAVPAMPQIQFCSDIMPMLQTRCGGPTCHGVSAPPDPALSSATGLVLATASGIAFTAIGVPAEETSTAAQSNATSPQNVFPVGMPIIDPGYPGDSYLLYKLLKQDTGGADSGRGTPSSLCTPATGPFNYGPSPGLASSDEAARLDALVPGVRMPWGDPALTIDEMERLRLWILQGAPVTVCMTCP